MANPWTDAENDLVVANYFEMLAKENAGNALNKTEHRRNLMRHLNRSKRAIEYKHCNISAVLKGLGEEWIDGYVPLFNFQMALVDAVERQLTKNPDWRKRPVAGTRDAKRFTIEEPPLNDESPLQDPEELEWMQHLARKFDVAQRDKQNRDLGRDGEKFVLAHERAVLVDSGREDLARKVRWVSEEDGDGAGYDIASFKPDGQERLLEVKTTNGWERTPFYITRNELRVAEERSAEWRLFRLWNFSREPKAFELRPPLEDHVQLTGMTFQASFH